MTYKDEIFLVNFFFDKFLVVSKTLENMRVTKPKSGRSSALKRLNATLKDVGLVGPKSRSASKKRTHPRDGNANISKLNSLAPNQINPFELKVNKVKHDVLGKKIKGVQGKPGLKRQIGIEKACI